MEKHYDVEAIRKDFPILQEPAYGKPLIYLDNGATTQKPRAVIEAVTNYYYRQNANVHRGAHYLSIQATEAHEQARKAVQKFIHAPQVESIIFTRNSTEGINQIAYGWATEQLKAGDEILITIAEHHSNLIPWQQVAARTGATLKYIYLLDDGTIDLGAYEQAFQNKGKVKLVAMQHTSNVLGTINPLEKMIRIAHANGAKVLVDGAQGVPHMKVNVEALDCDFLVFSGHKMLATMGIGVLYIKEDLLDQVSPLFFGGEMIDQVTEQTATFAPAPLRFEAGTPDVGASVGLASAIEYLENIDMQFIAQHEKKLTAYVLDQFQKLDDVTLYGPTQLEGRSGVISFNIKGVHPHDVATILDQEGIAIRSGHHCAQPLMQYLKVPATCRASFYLYNTMNEMEAFVDAVKSVRRWFPSGS